MKRCIIALALVAGSSQFAAAQSWAPWVNPWDPSYRTYQAPAPSYRMREEPDDEGDEPSQRSRPLRTGPAVLEGGGRPAISPIPPQTIGFRGSYAPGSIVIDTAARRLYLVQPGNRALVYPVAVGREGFAWTGKERITRVAAWPDWRPPAEMREREPALPEVMTGGIRNPLGAKALYLGNTLYRIHGTNSARSIGRAGSSGCFRMLNGHVVDLANRVGIGTQVHVVSRLPSNVAQLNAN